MIDDLNVCYCSGNYGKIISNLLWLHLKPQLIFVKNTWTIKFWAYLKFLFKYLKYSNKIKIEKSIFEFKITKKVFIWKLDNKIYLNESINLTGNLSMEIFCKFCLKIYNTFEHKKSQNSKIKYKKLPQKKNSI